LLDVWFSECGKHNVIGSDVRSSLYEGRRIAADFILERDGRSYRP